LLIVLTRSLLGMWYTRSSRHTLFMATRWRNKIVNSMFSWSRSLSITAIIFRVISHLAIYTVGPKQSTFISTISLENVQDVLRDYSYSLSQILSFNCRAGTCVANIFHSVKNIVWITKQSLTSFLNNTAIRWLVHWPLMGGLLHLVQRRRTWASCGHVQSPPRCTKCNSPPINGQCSNFILFDVAL